MVQLQRPEFVWYGGRIARWEEATFHVSSEALVRGLNVFEGLKGFWQPDGRFGIVCLREHYDRLRRSARLLHIPLDESYEEFAAAHHELVGRLATPDREMWIRATLYVEEGHWGEDTVSNLVLTAFHAARGLPDPIRVGVSAWRRAADSALPCRIKTSPNYEVARLARIEGRQHGYADMILLNPAGRVAESTGACVLVVADGAVATPPAWEGALPSITVDVIEALCADLGIAFTRRPVEHSELKTADEVALVGTLADVTPVVDVDGFRFDEHPVVDRIAARYLAAVTGVEPHPSVPLTCADDVERSRDVAGTS